MKKIFQPLLIILAFTLFACEGELKHQVESYRGDGQIEFLKAPGLLGSSGVRLRFPEIDLSKNYKETFNISGIPIGENYTVGLVVPPPNHHKFWPGALNYKVMKNGKIIKEVRESLASYTHSESPNRSRFYYYPKDNLDDFYLKIDSSDSSYIFEAEFVSSNIHEKVPAYLTIEFGGRK